MGFLKVQKVPYERTKVIKLLISEKEYSLDGILPASFFGYVKSDNLGYGDTHSAAMNQAEINFFDVVRM